MALTQVDIRLANSAVLTLGEGGSKVIEFQFPPHLKTDSKGAEWAEPKVRADESPAQYTLSKPRMLSLGWTYVVGMNTDRTWDVDRVKDQLKKLRSYFYSVEQKGKSTNLIGNIKLWKLGGSKPMTIRLLDVNFTYSKTYYVPEDDVNGSFPLQTDVSMDFRLWTGAAVSGSGSEKKLSITNLSDTVPEDWY